MAFFSNNTFVGSGDACARRDSALVFGNDVSVAEAANELCKTIGDCDAVLSVRARDFQRHLG